MALALTPACWGSDLIAEVFNAHLPRDKLSAKPHCYLRHVCKSYRAKITVHLIRVRDQTKRELLPTLTANAVSVVDCNVHASMGTLDDLAAILVLPNCSVRELYIRGHSHQMIAGMPLGALSRALSASPKLTKLTLCNVGLAQAYTSEFFIALRNTAHLTSLNLSRNSYPPVGDATASLLRTHPTLTKLDLSYNLLEWKDVEGLFQVLRKDKQLRSLNVRGSKFRDEADRAFVIADCLKENRTLSELDLSDSGLSSVCRIFGTLLSSRCGSDATLRILKLNATPSVMFECDLFFSQLGAYCAVTMLDLSGCGLYPASLRTLSSGLYGNTTMQHLNLSGNCVFNAGVLLLVENIKSMASLVSLGLRNCTLGSAAAWKLRYAVAFSRSLQFIDMRMNNMGPTIRRKIMGPKFTADYQEAKG